MAQAPKTPKAQEAEQPNLEPDIKSPQPPKKPEPPKTEAPVPDPVSLIGPPADVPQPQPREIIIPEVKEEPQNLPSTAACEVTRDDESRTITIK